MSNYYTIALNDYEYYKHMPKMSNFNNNNAVQCQQISEKLLKSVVMTQYPDKSSLKTHNLRILYEKVKNIINIPRESELYLSTLSDFYFDARYPGDDFCIVSDEHLSLCETTMNDIYKAVTEWYSVANTSSEDLLSLAMKSDVVDDNLDVDNLINAVLSRENLTNIINSESVRNLLPTAKLSESKLLEAIRYAIDLIKPRE